MDQKKELCYPAVFTCEEGQEIAVAFPDLDATTSGCDEGDALRSARELLGCVLQGMAEDGEVIPPPTPLGAVAIEAGEKVAPIKAADPGWYGSHL